MNLSDLLVFAPSRPTRPAVKSKAAYRSRPGVSIQAADSVSVIVSDAAAGYLVADDGGGWRALLDAGIEASPSSHGRRARSIAQTMGLAYARGSFLTDEVSEAQLGAAVVTVANASARWVSENLGERQQRIERDLRRRVSDALEKLFAESRIIRQARLSGATSKTYEFANVLDVRGRCLIVEPVANHAGAIAASFLTRRRRQCASRLCQGSRHRGARCLEV